MGVAASLEDRAAQITGEEAKAVKKEMERRFYKEAEEFSKELMAIEDEVETLEQEVSELDKQARLRASERFAEEGSKGGLKRYNELEEEERDKVFGENKELYEKLEKAQKKLGDKTAEGEAIRRKYQEELFELDRNRVAKLPETSEERAQRIEKAIIDRWAKRSGQVEKFERFKEQGLSDVEAAALAGWISGGDYFDFNAAIYDKFAIPNITPEKLEYIEEANSAIKRGLAKLPKVDREKMLEEAGKKGYRAEDFLEEGKYQRGIYIEGDPDVFLAKYRAAIGKSIIEEAHMAATGLKELGFIRRANIIYRINGRDSGGGNAVAMDEFKNANYEGEILYPAGQRFRVDNVTQGGDGKYYIDITEE